ncbi:GlxA family transcriptional regulator [Spiribacter halobius]|uniref:AraC family transcriptional regulator n=1 Tax=Sediminicurvatus halobius TaxID=2182432 RepID=A0A2U2N8J3_9GAMM|nr:helix-turn-helix domain-containing protein [Spiribacter halobius]PWG65393.1 AraC family transcriptional regulator [Spiribacter halobius]UEX76413.1 helix-turn-helix domain-containing protein [Spiribacter halobius]
MMDVTVVLLGGNYASTALAPVEVFHSAGQLWPALTGGAGEPAFRVTMASIDGGPVTTAYGLELTPRAALADVAHSDIVMVPASGLELDAQIARYRELFPWLRECQARGSFIAGVCTGTAYLAEAGLLDGRQATTHWALGDAYRARYPQVDWRPELFITEDRHVLCAGGVFAAVDLSLYLVEKFCGRELARQCARSLLVDMPRTSQSGYAVLPLSRPHGDERIREVERYLAENCARDLPVKHLAERACMSPRTFVRRFKAATGRMPGQYLQLQRIGLAREMLEASTLTVQQVSERVGYEDVAFFRRLFRRVTGMSPAEYRMRFAGRPAVSNPPAVAS